MLLRIVVMGRERVRFNSDGQLVGEERHNVISTIGAVTKTLVSILSMDLRKVPKNSKEKKYGNTFRYAL